MLPGARKRQELAEADHVSVDKLVAAPVNEGVGDCEGYKLTQNEAPLRS